MMVRKIVTRLCAGFLSIFCLTSCAKNSDSLTVHIQSSLQIPTEADTLSVQIFEGEAQLHETAMQLGPAPRDVWPQTLPLVLEREVSAGLRLRIATHTTSVTPSVLTGAVELELPAEWEQQQISAALESACGRTGGVDCVGLNNSCTKDLECASQVCEDTICTLPNCNDGRKNQDETDIDCGGVCLPCASATSCRDKTQNGDETGIDCGGSCNPCPPPPRELLTQLDALNGTNGLIIDSPDQVLGQLGHNLACGDMDGDGKQELLFFAKKITDHNKGHLVILWGGQHRNHTNGLFNWNTSARMTVVISGDRASFGEAGVSLGDANNDGLADVLINDADFSDGATATTGADILLYGHTNLSSILAIDLQQGTRNSVPAVVKLSANANHGQSFHSLRFVGDISGDDRDDFAIGQPFFPTAAGTRPDAGRVRLVASAGSPTSWPADIVDLDAQDANVSYALFEGTHNQEYLGQAFGAVGDIDGDNNTDLAIGAPAHGTSQTPHLFLLFGSGALPMSADLDDGASHGDVLVLTNAVGSRFGDSINTAPGDVNDDGYDDLLVGSYGSPSTHVYLIMGAHKNFLGVGASRPISNVAAVTFSGLPAHPIQVPFEPNREEDRYTLTFSRDLNGDNIDDILIGVPKQNRVYVIYGRKSWTTTTSKLEIDLAQLTLTDGFVLQLGNEPTEGSVGRAIATCDINGDGLSDIITSAPDYGQMDIGRIFVVYGTRS